VIRLYQFHVLDHLMVTVVQPLGSPSIQVVQGSCSSSVQGNITGISSSAVLHPSA